MQEVLRPTWTGTSLVAGPTAVAMTGAVLEPKYPPSRVEAGFLASIRRFALSQVSTPGWKGLMQSSTSQVSTMPLVAYPTTYFTVLYVS